MKPYILFGSILLVSFFTLAFVYSPFRSWNALIDSSENIMVIRCEHSFRGFFGGGLSKAEFTVVDLLKGKMADEKGVLKSSYSLRQGEYYLIFANYNYGFYDALPEFRVVPIFGQYNKSTASGETLKAKVFSLLKRRLDFLKMEMERDAEEKKRLEQAFE